jgi:transcriptional regulator with XRE-family HTH domain
MSMRLASVLKAWRHRHEMSVREAAGRLGLPSSTYAGIERGRAMSGETLAHIVRWLTEREFPC